MSESVTVTGMVLSTMPVNDYDRRVVLLSKERGKITAFARGARRMNSQLMGRTNPFCFGEFDVYEGRSSYTISQARILNYFEKLTADMEQVCYGSYFLELANYYTFENMNAVNELNLLYASFRALQNDAIPNPLVRYIMELKMMVFHGSYPECFCCHQCGGTEKLLHFSCAKGGVLCDACAGAAADCIDIGSSTLYTLQYIISTPVKKLFSFTVSDEVLTELKMIMGRLQFLYMDRKFKSLEMLELIS
jgi:DNA repair protein RecO (recombination protein O)